MNLSRVTTINGDIIRIARYPNLRDCSESTIVFVMSNKDTLWITWVLDVMAVKIPYTAGRYI